MLQFINAEFTVVQKPNMVVPQKGLFIFLGWLFGFFFSTKKEKKKILLLINPATILQIPVLFYPLSFKTGKHVSYNQ